ncbi:MAG: hypothetical protein E3J87_07900 [Candidatus Cloacimonadota bacterium]|nr:MAG: hypothetical protein E3J87_07900 [Candidatus Cloacimonadota bacterium]
MDKVKKGTFVYFCFALIIIISGCYNGYYYDDSENHITISPLLNCGKPKETKILRMGAELSTKTSRKYDYYYGAYEPQVNDVMKLFISKSIKYFSIDVGFFEDINEFGLGVHIPTEKLILSIKVNEALKNNELFTSGSIALTQENKDYSVFGAFKYGTFPQYIRYLTYDTLYNEVEYVKNYKVNGYIFALGFDYPIFKNVGCKSDFEFISIPAAKSFRYYDYWYYYNGDYTISNSPFSTIRIGIGIYVDM